MNLKANFQNTAFFNSLLAVNRPDGPSLMSRLLEQLASNTPSLWVEVSPPRGINLEPLLRRLSTVRNKVDAST